MGLGRDWRRLIWGVVLMLYGGLFIAERFGVLPPWAIEFRWWPLIVITIGLSKFILPRSADDVGSGVTLTMLGMWFLLVSNEWFGLDWMNSWPLALVAAGAGMVVRSLAGFWLPDQKRIVKEERNV